MECTAHGLQFAALRYFNAAGADSEGEMGELHDPETHLIPLAILAALGHGPPLHIFGTDYPTSDGTAVRDYVHVTDLARAHVAALRYLEHGGESGAFNLGTGVGVSVRQVVDCVEAVSGRQVPALQVTRRDGDPETLVAEPRRANSVLGWQPRCSDIRTIVDTAWRWHRNGLRGRHEADVRTATSPVGLEAVLIGNAAAALRGAPVTTVDFDFLFRKTPRSLIKLKALARGLRATSPCSRFWRPHLKKPISRRVRLAALARESERNLRDMIRRWQALPPARRTNFLRKRLAPGRTAL